MSSERLMELIARCPPALYGWKPSVPSGACIIRPGIGSAAFSTVSSRPILRSASIPRSEIARLIERPRSGAASRGSGLRSYRVTS
ncbi:hypothetical protein GCM10018952_63310 [Streptosporangium vulgare]